MKTNQKQQQKTEDGMKITYREIDGHRSLINIKGGEDKKQHEFMNKRRND